MRAIWIIISGATAFGLIILGKVFGPIAVAESQGRMQDNHVEQIVFSYIGGPEHIYIVGLDGSNPRILVDQQYATFRPVWSPDESHILFTATINDRHAIGRVNPDGSGYEIISDPELSWGDPDYNSAGTNIVFFTDEPHPRNLYILDVATGETSLLTNTPDINEASPRWSPDDSAIVFVGRESGESDIWLIDPATGVRTNITRTPDIGEFHPEWAPNGRQVVFIRAGAPEWTVVVMDVQSQTETVLARGGDGVVLSPHFSSDGTTVTFTRTSFDDDSEMVPTLVGYSIAEQIEFTITPATLFE